ncbi:hypothetical protein [Streptomyces rubrogriseus]
MIGHGAGGAGLRMAVADSRHRLTTDDQRFVVAKPYSRLGAQGLSR